MKQYRISFLSFLLLLNSCAATPVERGLDMTAPNPQSMNERAVGDAIHREILVSFYPYTDPKVVRYVGDTGRQLAAHAKRKDLEYQFTILYNEKIYATSAPGGYIYVTTGMLNFLNNEAELAAILAHEIAELQYKDPRLSKQEAIFHQVVQAGTAIAPLFGPFGSLAALGLVLAEAYNESTHKTPWERLFESDEAAMGYLLKTGYDPQALWDVQEHFLRAGEKLAPYFYDYYQSRPVTEARMVSLKKAFQKLPLMEKNLITDPVEYQDVMKGVREIYRA